MTISEQLKRSQELKYRKALRVRARANGRTEEDQEEREKQEEQQKKLVNAIAEKVTTGGVDQEKLTQALLTHLGPQTPEALRELTLKIEKAMAAGGPVDVVKLAQALASHLGPRKEVPQEDAGPPEPVRIPFDDVNTIIEHLQKSFP